MNKTGGKLFVTLKSDWHPETFEKLNEDLLMMETNKDYS